jgi:hypothetical protein
MKNPIVNGEFKLSHTWNYFRIHENWKILVRLKWKLFLVINEYLSSNKKSYKYSSLKRIKNNLEINSAFFYFDVLWYVLSIYSISNIIFMIQI